MPNKAKIDEIDAKILKTLLGESRMSFTKIAKDCKISVAAVRMRYNRLKKAGIIKGEIIEVNPYSLGYRCIADIGIITAVDDEKEVRENLKSKGYFLGTARFGKYNILALVALPSIEKLGWIIENIESNPRIKHSDTLIWAEVTDTEYPENLVIKSFECKNESKTAEKAAANEFEDTQMDATDRQILKTLLQNSRIPFKQIAEQLGISTTTVIQRYRRLRERNVITNSTITLDLNKLGYNALALVFIKVVNRSKIPMIYAQLLQIANLIIAVKHIGIYDLRAFVAVTDFKDVFRLTEQIYRIEGIDQADITLHEIFPWPFGLFNELL